MSSIYVYDGPFHQGVKGYPLIKEAASRYCKEWGFDYHVMGAEILREERGKPYFLDIPLFFSLSHSGGLWMCVIADNPCGLDLQEIKQCQYLKIAKRQFTEGEQHYVGLCGLDGFFDIWTRKEAFCKCTGQGFFTEMPSMVTDDGKLVQQIEWKKNDYFFLEMALVNQFKCMVCTVEKTDIKIRRLI